jgi:hypothetical protein
MKTRNEISLSVSELVREVLANISQPYPENITDKVCLAIQENVVWHNRYDRLIERYNKWSVNPQIGRSTLQITGLKNLGLQARSKSKLIKTYTRLG